MRYALFFLPVMFLLSCAKKVPPPGKGEFRGPKVILFSPENGDTVGDTLRVYVYAEDSSGLTAFVIKRRSKVITLIPVKGRSYSLDTFLVLEREGETLLPDTLEIGANDRWDNHSGIRVEVYTYRQARDTSVQDKGKEGGK